MLPPLTMPLSEINPVTRGSLALVWTLIAGSFGLSAGVALALLGAAFLWVQ